MAIKSLMENCVDLSKLGEDCGQRRSRWIIDGESPLVSRVAAWS